MSFTKVNYKPGDVLTSDQTNKIQDAIVSNEGNIEAHIRATNPHKITPTSIGAATTVTYNATVATSWTESEGCYYQDITVTGILETDNPIVDIMSGNDNSSNKLYNKAIGKVFRIVTYDNKIRVYATEAIDIAFPIQLKVVR